MVKSRLGYHRTGTQGKDRLRDGRAHPREPKARGHQPFEIAAGLPLTVTRSRSDTFDPATGSTSGSPPGLPMPCPVHNLITERISPGRAPIMKLKQLSRKQSLLCSALLICALLLAGNLIVWRSSSALTSAAVGEASFCKAGEHRTQALQLRPSDQRSLLADISTMQTALRATVRSIRSGAQEVLNAAAGLAADAVHVADGSPAQSDAACTLDCRQRQPSRTAVARPRPGRRQVPPVRSRRLDAAGTDSARPAAAVE